jgi:hypothetical protein
MLEKYFKTSTKGKDSKSVCRTETRVKNGGIKAKKKKMGGTGIKNIYIYIA